MKVLLTVEGEYLGDKQNGLHLTDGVSNIYIQRQGKNVTIDDIPGSGFCVTNSAEVLLTALESYFKFAKHYETTSEVGNG